MDLFDGFPKYGSLRKLMIDFGKRYSEIACHFTSSIDDLNKLEKIRIWAVKCETKNVFLVIERILDESKSARNEIPTKVIGDQSEKYVDKLGEFGLSASVGDFNKYLVEGFYLLLNEIEYEVFTFKGLESHPLFNRFNYSTLEPFFIVTMDDDATIIKVNSPESFEVVGRCGIYWSEVFQFGSSLTTDQEFDNYLEVAKDVTFLPRIQITNTPKELENIGDTDASKPAGDSKNDRLEKLLSISFEYIGQLISLYADFHGVNKVFFVRSYTSHDLCCLKNITKSINRASNEKVSVMFLRHESFVGVIGGIFGSMNSSEKQRTYFENKANTSGIFSEEQVEMKGIKIMKLTIDSEMTQLAPCPLLKDISVYNPDLINMSINTEMRMHAIDQINRAFNSKMNQGISRLPEEKAQLMLKFQEKVYNKLQYIKQNPWAFGHLSERVILDIVSQYKADQMIRDFYIEEKISSNNAALLKLKEHLVSIDKLDFKERQCELIKNIIAGNVLDWGSIELIQLLKSKSFGMEVAKQKLPSRPWLIDDLNKWVARMEGPPHKRAAIFVDNSGIDIVLGIIPFTRELIERGTEVMLCAVSEPILNDITVKELDELLVRVSEICPVIKKALENSTLKTFPTGQRGPYLDLSRLDKTLADQMKEVDLVVIEGMGRTVFGNLFEALTCEVLKVVILKDKLFAANIGGSMFDAVCKYEQ